MPQQRAPERAQERSRDRRIARTERALRDALAVLLHEKPYDAIAVKEILARADVGRSTFYAHFPGKDALLARCVRDMLSAACASRGVAPTRPHDRLLGFSLPVLEFHARQRRVHGTPVDPATRALLHERLQGRLAARVAAELRRQRGGEASPPVVPTELLARHVATAFGAVLAWELEQGAALAPHEADARFRALVTPTLDVALDAAGT